MMTRTDDTPFAIGAPYSLQGTGATAILIATMPDGAGDTARTEQAGSNNGLMTVEPVDWEI